MAKANFVKLCLINDRMMTRSRFEELVHQSLTMISVDKLNNIHGHNRHHIVKHLA